MPKNSAKDTTNKSVPVSITANDAIGRGDEKTRRVTHESELSESQQVLVRTEPSAATKDDGKYRKHFMVQHRDDYDDEQHADMHEANKLATLQEALGAGVHPKGDVVFEGTQETPQSGSIILVYAVEGVPAELDADAPGTTVPRALLLDMPGASSVVGDTGVNHR